MTASQSKAAPWLRPPVLALCLSLLSLVPFFGAIDHGFVNFDDDIYVVNNEWVHQGLTTESLSWAFSSFYNSNWHPLTWVSYLIDFELFGLRPSGYHLTSLLIHGVNAGLLFLVLCRLTAAVGRSAAVAALWAVHPLRVESVVWISERKDVLSLLFGLLAIEFYRRSVASNRPRDRILTALMMALGLMAKPMLVTLPILLIALDFWPLNRSFASWSDCRQRVIEKWPLWLLTAGSCYITLRAQAAAMVPLQSLALSERLKNAALSIGQYAADQVIPHNLAPLYPMDLSNGASSGWILSASLIIGISLLVFFARRRVPTLLTGWSWFLVALVPVLGIVQVGGQSRADRYTYLPSIGLTILVVFGLWEFLPRSTHPKSSRRIAVTTWTIALVALSAATIRQVDYWQDSVTLFTRALATAGPSYIIHLNLAEGYSSAGRTAEAVEHYQLAIRFAPDQPEAYSNLAAPLQDLGHPDQALAALDQALELAPLRTQILVNRAALLDDLGRSSEAIRDLALAFAVDPGLPRARQGLAAVLARVPRAEALGSVEDAASIAPDPSPLTPVLDRLSATSEGDLD